MAKGKEEKKEEKTASQGMITNEVKRRQQIQEEG